MPERSALDRVKLMVGMEPEHPPELLDDLNECFALSRMQRLYGFGICISAGILCSFLSSLMWLRPTKFAILYTLGNLLSLGSTGFLMGFWNQLKGMFKGTRVVASCVYLAAMVMTLVSACYLKNFGLTIICIVIQSCALAWYCLSYIPGGRAAISSILR
eukprot:CAMPEP_0197591262 /NCGR_PEP_ID=MMETSP1326-20131121/12976_1 /TAXON_ID=1155430 /ORGANISM="Genus nov. species nov., Strain RCC2288" /LENGTH=158 /DNA_ID=CAMNT_0043156661 /DNA_START=347 /DNA_END=820 /DNA_ORIENTATION=-